MVHCNINLADNGRGVYFAGEVLKGSIELILDNPKKIRGLYFIVYGAGRCHWTETRSETTGTGENRRTRTRTIHFEGKDVYLNSKTYLFGSSGAEAKDIESGLHTFEFACPLPQLLPASFEAAHGSICYHIEVVMDIPWKFDKEFKCQFTVVRIDDLNLKPDLRIATKSEEIKRFCCLCCQSDPLIMTVTLPFSGYAPGQSMNITVDYVNKSDVRVIDTYFQFRRAIHYNSYTPERKTRVETMNVAEEYSEGVEADKSKTIFKTMAIPSVLMNTNTEYCNVIRLFYELEVTARVEGCHSNVSVTIPVTIGSIPLNFEVPNMQQPTQFYQIPTPIMPFLPPVTIPSAPVEMPPPSFEDAIKNVKADIVDSSSFMQPSAPVLQLTSEPMPVSGLMTANAISSNLGWNIDIPIQEPTGSNKKII